MLAVFWDPSHKVSSLRSSKFSFIFTQWYGRDDSLMVYTLFVIPNVYEESLFASSEIPPFGSGWQCWRFFEIPRRFALLGMTVLWSASPLSFRMYMRNLSSRVLRSLPSVRDDSLMVSTNANRSNIQKKLVTRHVFYILTAGLSHLLNKTLFNFYFAIKTNKSHYICIENFWTILSFLKQQCQQNYTYTPITPTWKRIS